MGREVRCPNPACGRPSTLGNDPLGRVFRCRHCRTKLSARSRGEAAPRSAPPEVTGGDTSGITMIAGLAIDSQSWDDVISSPGESSTAAAPSRLGRFWVLEPLGSGTFATVYRAVDPELQRDVALKVPHEGLLTEPRVVDRFLDEARALARLRHPRIVPIYEVGSRWCLLLLRHGPDRGAGPGRRHPYAARPRTGVRPGSRATWRTPWPMPTNTASCTATLSRPTS